MGGPLHHAGAFGKRRVLPVLKCRVCLGNDITHCGWSQLVVCLDSFACGGVDSLECHTMSSCVVSDCLVLPEEYPMRACCGSITTPRMAREVEDGAAMPYD